MRAIHRFLSLLACTALLAGCASQSMLVRGYDGDALPPERIATVAIPVQMEVFEVSGLPVRSPNVDHGVYQLEVPAGEQQLLLQYVELWPGAAAGSELVRSRSMSLVADFRAGGRYRIDYPAPANRDEAERFAAAPSAELVSEDDQQRVSAKVRPASQQGLFGRAPGNFRPAPTTTAPAAPPTAPAAPAAAGDSEALNQLKHWWNRAGEQDRAAFLQWMVGGNR